jgi:hypothetical protein
MFEGDGKVSKRKELQWEMKQVIIKQKIVI